MTTTECIIVDQPEDKKNSMPPMPPGGDMY